MGISNLVVCKTGEMDLINITQNCSVRTRLTAS